MKFPNVDKLKQNGRRIYIRPLQLSDFAAWKELHSTLPAPQSEFDLPPAYEPRKRTIKTFRRVVRSVRKSICEGGDCFWGIFLKNNRLIGRIGLMNINRDSYQSADITYRIYSPFWRRGYAKDAIQACLKAAFTKLKLNRIEAHIEPVNKPSIRTAESAGFRKEGIGRKKLFTRKQWRDMLVYSAICTDYGFQLNPPDDTDC